MDKETEGGTAATGSREYEELRAILAPYMTLQVVTPDALLAGLLFITGKLAALATAGTADGSEEYLPAYKLGRRYGMTKKGIDPYLLHWVAAGEVERITPVHPATGRPGHALYKVADVARMMKRKNTARKG